MAKLTLSPRTEPQQDRSRVRVREILDATEVLILEVGYDRINTNLIAAQAGMPVGTIYRYFSNKYGIFAALAKRAFVELEYEWLKLGQPDPASTSVEDYFDLATDMMISFWLERKPAMQLWAVLRRTPEMRTVSESFDDIVVTRNAETLKRYYPSLSQQQRLISGLIIEETGAALLNRMVTMNAPDQRLLTLEIKQLIRSYVSSLEK